MTNNEIEGRAGDGPSPALEALWRLVDRWADEGAKVPYSEFDIGYRQAKRQDALELKTALEDL